MKNIWRRSMKHWCFRIQSLLTILIVATLYDVETARAAQAEPNIVLIMADDMGFSDLGSYGGEISTPNLDRLAFEGTRYTNLYVAATCSPTRGMLLTGLDSHLVGMGNMHERTAPNQLQEPGYEGVLQPDLTTVADVLKSHGYHTYMAGKWHLGHEPTQIPSARGFERTYSLINGAGSHFNLTGANIQNERSEFTADGKYLDKLSRKHYSSRTFTDKIIEFVDSNRSDGQPFFAYLAYQAPHDPIQVPTSWLRKYKGHYDDGWDVIRERRLQRMKELGVIGKNAELSPRLWYVPEWDDLTGIAQVQAARRMELYASMVEYLDREVGRLVDHLEQQGLLDNTYIVFLSDNGPNPNDPIAQAKQRAGAMMAANFFATDYKTDFESWGRHDGFVAQSAPWAQVSATPFTGFKLTSYEGGIRSPLIVWRGGGTQKPSVDIESVIHVSDIAPTILEAAGISPNELVAETKGIQIGRSWARTINGTASPEQRPANRFGMELFGGRAFRDGQWKITWMHAPFGIDDWQLFDIVDDPAELHDLSASHPDIKARLVDSWNAYAKNNNVIIPDRTVFDGMEDNLPPRPPVDSPNWPRGQEENWRSEADEE